MTEEHAKMSVGKKIVILCILLFAILTAAAYFVGVQYFTNHFLPGSMVNGFNCSYMDVEEAEGLLKEKAAAYVLALNTRNNGRESITAEDAGIKYVSTGGMKELIQKQDRYKWFLAFNQKKNYELKSSITYDKDKLEAAVDNLYCMQPENIEEPVDAQLWDNGEAFIIVPESEGNSPDREKLVKWIANSLLTGNMTLDLEAEGIYKKPNVYQDDEELQKNLKQVNKLTDIIITYDFADRTETVDRSVIKNWLVKSKKGNYTLSRKKVAEYVNELGYKYDTFGLSRTFITYDGREKLIPGGGDYGWVIDQEAETKALIKAIKSGKTQVREPIYLYRGWSRDSYDVGYTYVEIDLTNQRLVFYKDGYPIVNTYVVTGNPNIPGNETPEGCFAIDAKKSPATLTGEDYAAPVTYWMPFAGNVGLHDAPWRTEFGNNIYMFEGSHGCVNMPYGDAQTLYNNVEIGMPVVVYK